MKRLTLSVFGSSDNFRKFFKILAFSRKKLGVMKLHTEKFALKNAIQTDKLGTHKILHEALTPSNISVTHLVLLWSKKKFYASGAACKLPQALHCHVLLRIHVKLVQL